MNKIYVGIDFSLKSPGVCIFKDGEYKWITHCSKVVKPKKDIKTQEDIQLLNDVNMSFHGELLTGTDYTSNHRADIINYRMHAENLLELIRSEIGDASKYDSVHFAFEGYSFNSFSNSNNIIDIVAATTTFKNVLIDQYPIDDSDKFTIDIVAPIKLKQYAGYSKFDKVDLFDIFTGDYTYIREKWSDAIQKDHDKKVAKGKPSVFKWDFNDPDISGPFYDFCCAYEINRAVKKPQVPKPVDDLIDGYFLVNYMREVLYPLKD